MGIKSGRRLPQRDTPVIGSDGRMSLDWYAYFRALDDELGGLGFSTLLASPQRGGALAGTSAIAGAAGTLSITVDGNTYNLVHE